MYEEIKKFKSFMEIKNTKFSQEDKENLKSILKALINDFPYYTTEGLLKERIANLNNGDVMTLKKLIQQYGFNLICLDTKKEVLYGYDECDFKGYLNKKVVVDSFYYDDNNYLMIEISLKEN